MSAETLRRAAALMREANTSSVDPAHDDPFMLAVADWLDAEAAEYERLYAQSFAVNILLATADEKVEARVSLGYHTLDKALAVARAYLGELS